MMPDIRAGQGDQGASPIFKNGVFRRTMVSLGMLARPEADRRWAEISCQNCS